MQILRSQSCDGLKRQEVRTFRCKVLFWRLDWVCSLVIFLSFVALGESARIDERAGKADEKAVGARPLTEEQSNSELEKRADDLENFKASEGWIDRFKHRHSIVFKGNQGEAADIDLEVLGNWQMDVLHKEITHFSADDVFNADETDSSDSCCRTRLWRSKVSVAHRARNRGSASLFWWERTCREPRSFLCSSSESLPKNA